MTRRFRLGVIALSCVIVSVAAVNAQNGQVPNLPGSLINDYVMAFTETPASARTIVHACAAREKDGALRIAVPVITQTGSVDRRDQFIAEKVVVDYFSFDQTFTCQPGEGFNIVNISLHAQPARARFDDDAVKLDPKHNQVLFENDKVRVVRVHFLPGESGPVVDKRARIILSLADSHASVTLPDGHSEVRDATAGSITFGAAGRQATNNIGMTPIENIVVELKGK
jgi:hypothetical protein